METADQMITDFAPRLDIVPPPRRRLWDDLATVPTEFVLYAGTASRCTLGIVSQWTFGDRPLDKGLLALAIPFLAGAIVTQLAPNTFSCTTDRGGVIPIVLLRPARFSPPVAATGRTGQRLAGGFVTRPVRHQDVSGAGARRGEGLHRPRRSAMRRPHRSADRAGCRAGNLWNCV